MPRSVRLDLGERAIESFAHSIRPESICVEALALGSSLSTQHDRCQPLGEDKWYLSRGTIVTHQLWQGFCETTARTLAEKQVRAAMTPKIDASEAAAVVGNSQI